MKNDIGNVSVELKEKDNRKISFLRYAFLLLICILYAFFYGGFYPFTLLYIVIALPVLSILYLGTIYFNFKSSQELNERIFVKGEHASYILHLQNSSFLFIPFIKINMYIEGQVICKKMQNIKLSLAPFSRHDLEFKIELFYRGVYDVGVSSIKISDLLGLFTYTVYPPEKKTILVKPRIMQKYSSDEITVKINEGEQSKEYNDSGNDEVVNIREYVYGDSFRKIHWNLSSKLDKLMIKETKNETKSESIFYLNLYKHEVLDEITLLKEDCLIEEIVKHIHYHLKKDMSSRLVFFNGETQTVRGSSQQDFLNIYNVLSEVRFNQDYDFNQILEPYIEKNQFGNLLYVFSVKINVNMIDTLLKIKNKGFNIVVYFIEFEYIESDEYEEEDIIEILSKQNINANRLTPLITLDHEINNLDNTILEGA